MRTEVRSSELKSLTVYSEGLELMRVCWASHMHIMKAGMHSSGSWERERKDLMALKQVPALGVPYNYSSVSRIFFGSVKSLTGTLRAGSRLLMMIPNAFSLSFAASEALEFGTSTVPLIMPQITFFLQ